MQTQVDKLTLCYDLSSTNSKHTTSTVEADNFKFCFNQNF